MQYTKNQKFNFSKNLTNILSYLFFYTYKRVFYSVFTFDFYIYFNFLIYFYNATGRDLENCILSVGMANKEIDILLKVFYFYAAVQQKIAYQFYKKNF